MQALSLEDRQDKPLSAEFAERTFAQFKAHPDQGGIIVFEADTELVGYAILINFWSNEFGGNVLNVDELYVVPNWRGQGIGTGLMEYLITTKYNQAVMLQLEVSPDNERARKLYTSLGFVTYKNETLTKMLI